MKKTKNRLNFTFKVIKNDKVVDRCQTHSKRRFYNRIRRINWKIGVKKVYLRVSYGKGINNFGKMTPFYNDGWYGNKSDLWMAVAAFSEQ